jgi:hypothetical protein
MYQLIADPYAGGIIGVKNLENGASIPFDPANTDYQQFKVDVAAGVPLEDPEGNVMTQEQVDDFLKTIP